MRTSSSRTPWWLPKWRWLAILPRMYAPPARAWHQGLQMDAITGIIHVAIPECSYNNTFLTTPSDLKGYNLFCYTKAANNNLLCYNTLRHNNVCLTTDYEFEATLSLDTQLMQTPMGFATDLVRTTVWRFSDNSHQTRKYIRRVTL